MYHVNKNLSQSQISMWLFFNDRGLLLIFYSNVQKFPEFFELVNWRGGGGGEKQYSLDKMSTLANVQFTHTSRYEFDAATLRFGHSDVVFDLFIEACFLHLITLLLNFSNFFSYFIQMYKNSNNSLNWFTEGGGKQYSLDKN